jgi:rod shape-determining protein MreC
VLQIIALSFLFRFNKFHEAAFMGVANELTGRVSSRYTNIEYYFHLKKTNESLARQNEQLLNQLNTNFQSPDSLTMVVIDSSKVDTVNTLRRYLWRGARVVNNSVSLQNNYITIHRGERQGVKKDMGVISPDGIVGMVVNTSENFSVVMTMLNRQSSVSAKLKKTGEIGKVQWDGKSPDYITMVNIPKSVKVSKGDSVVTSGYSLSFPPNIMVGVVSDIVDDQTSNFYTLRLKPSTNFYSVEYVTVVDNLQRNEQTRLEEATRRNQ